MHQRSVLGLPTLALVFLLPASGCNTESDSNRTAPTSAAVNCDDAVRSLCTAYANREMSCDGKTASQRDADIASCITDAADLPVNCEYVQGVSNCLSTLACDTSDDKCVWEGFLAAKPTGWNIDTLRACVAGTNTDEAACRAALGGDTRTCLNRLEECIGGPYEGATNPPYTDDNCYSLVALTPEATQAAVSCLSLACDQIRECLHAAGTFNY